MSASIAPGYVLVYNDKGIVIGARKPDGSFTTPQARDWYAKHGSANPANAYVPPNPGPADGAIKLPSGVTAIYNDKGVAIGARMPDGSYSTEQASNADVVPAKPVQPFLTPEQQQAQIEGKKSYDLGVLDIDEGLDKTKIDTAYQKTLIDRNLLKDTNTTVDAMIARGLLQSGIKDSAIWDLNQTATIQKSHLDTVAESASIWAGRRKKILDDSYRDAYDPNNPNSAVAKQRIQNADDTNKTLQPGTREAQPLATFKPPALVPSPRAAAPTPSTSSKPTASIDPLTGGVRAPEEW